MSEIRPRSVSHSRTGKRIVVRLPPRPNSSSGNAQRPSKLFPPPSVSPESLLRPSRSLGESQVNGLPFRPLNSFSAALPKSTSSQSPLLVPYTFGLPYENSQHFHQNNKFTFRSLHNVTPRPSNENIASQFQSLSVDTPQASSTERDTPQLTPSSSHSPSVSFSSLSALPPADQDPPQLLQTAYSDEKIVLDDRDDLPDPVELSTALPTDFAAEICSISASQAAPKFLITQPTISEAPVPQEVNNVHDRYDVRDEESPQQPFFDPALQEALQSGMAIAKSVVSGIERLGDPSSLGGNITKLLEDARELSSFQTSNTRTIAVLGDTGHGKSSLISSLLHFPEIARSAGIGRAGTSVVTEYRDKTKDHTAPLTMEVEYFGSSEIQDMIADLVCKYRLILMLEEDVQQMSHEVYAKFEEDSKQAWSTLETVFKHDAQFSREYLNDTSEGARDRITAHLQQCARGIDWPERNDTGLWTATADTADELWDKAGVFMNDRCWPFTKIIRVYLSAQVLKTGVVLADLPGLQDTNLARVRAAETYLMKCDHVLVVAEINRAVASRSLDKCVSGVLQRHIPMRWKASGGKHLNVAVICTKSEDLAPKAIRRDLNRSGRLSDTHIQRLLELDRAIAQASAAKDVHGWEAAKLRQRLILMEARNQSVKNDLQEAYSLEIPGKELEVFCVSNTMYEEYTDLNDIAMVQASGIPTLRKFCHTITAEAQLLEAKHFLKSSLSSLLCSVAMLARNSSNLARIESNDNVTREDIESRVEQAEVEVLRSIDYASKRFHDSFRENFLVLLENRPEAWSKAAKLQSDAWYNRMKHWTQFHAWCAHDGAWATNKLEYEDWNAQIIWKMRQELGIPWEMTEEDISSIFKELLEAMTKELRGLMSFDNDYALASEWSEAIESRLRGIEYELNQGQLTTENEVKLIRGWASESNSTSYILREMLPTYQEAKDQSGTGRKSRQNAILQRRITDGIMFPSISFSIVEDIDTLNCTRSLALRNKLQSVFARIKLDLNNALPPALEDGDVAQQDEVESMQRLLDEVEDLKARHEEVLRSIDDC